MDEQETKAWKEFDRVWYASVELSRDDAYDAAQAAFRTAMSAKALEHGGAVVASKVSFICI